jgi:NAD(P)-dependent dehydrogenase (short-subunit alcohol dehydrogenase family)
MVRAKQAGKIVFVGSILSYFGIIGYSPYNPGKHAIKGAFFFTAFGVCELIYSNRSGGDASTGIPSL